MPVYVERHRDGGVAQQILDLLRRQLPTTACLRVDAPASKEMPESVRRILGFSILIDEASRFQNGVDTALADDRIVLRLARFRRKYEITRWTLSTP
jgi:hypothetical protein